MSSSSAESIVTIGTAVQFLYTGRTVDGVITGIQDADHAVVVQFILGNGDKEEISIPRGAVYIPG